MSENITSEKNRRIRRGQHHFVSSTDETGLGAVDAVADESAPSSMWGEAWKNLRRRTIFWISGTLIVIAILMAALPGLFTSINPTSCSLDNGYAPPTAGHIFGFDKQGCDIYSHIIYGARASVTVGICSTIAVVIIGGLIGSLAGFFGGWFDALLSRIVDIFFAIPMFLGAIVIMQLFKNSRSVWMVVIVLATFGWTSIARITRGAVMSAKNEEFVTASRALGSSKMRQLFSHIIPNSLAPVIVYATVALGTFIVAEASLSFLGIGLPASVVSWGGDISAGQSALRDQPMVLFYPAMALALTVLSFIMMGDAVRDALDPKARKK